MTPAELVGTGADVVPSPFARRSGPALTRPSMRGIAYAPGTLRVRPLRARQSGLP
jgi:hypothetical protein